MALLGMDDIDAMIRINYSKCQAQCGADPWQVCNLDNGRCSSITKSTGRPRIYNIMMRKYANQATFDPQLRVIGSTDHVNRLRRILGLAPGAQPAAPPVPVLPPAPVAPPSAIFPPTIPPVPMAPPPSIPRLPPPAPPTLELTEEIPTITSQLPETLEITPIGPPIYQPISEKPKLVVPLPAALPPIVPPLVQQPAFPLPAGAYPLKGCVQTGCPAGKMCHINTGKCVKTMPRGNKIARRIAGRTFVGSPDAVEAVQKAFQEGKLGPAVGGPAVARPAAPIIPPIAPLPAAEVPLKECAFTGCPPGEMCNLNSGKCVRTMPKGAGNMTEVIGNQTYVGTPDKIGAIREAYRRGEIELPIGASIPSTRPAFYPPPESLAPPMRPPPLPPTAPPPLSTIPPPLLPPSIPPPLPPELLEIPIGQLPPPPPPPGTEILEIPTKPLPKPPIIKKPLPVPPKPIPAPPPLKGPEELVIEIQREEKAGNIQRILDSIDQFGALDSPYNYQFFDSPIWSMLVQDADEDADEIKRSLNNLIYHQQLSHSLRDLGYPPEQVVDALIQEFNESNPPLPLKKEELEEITITPTVTPSIPPPPMVAPPPPITAAPLPPVQRPPSVAFYPSSISGPEKRVEELVITRPTTGVPTGAGLEEMITTLKKAAPEKRILPPTTKARPEERASTLPALGTLTERDKRELQSKMESCLASL